MKGVVLAGGLGTPASAPYRGLQTRLCCRLRKPMISIDTRPCGRRDSPISWLSRRQKMRATFLRLIGNGEDFRPAPYELAPIEEEGGIADALKLGPLFRRRRQSGRYLGDNFIQGSIRRAVGDFGKQPCWRQDLSKEVPIRGVRVGELPTGRPVGHVARSSKNPPSPPRNSAVVGIYFYDSGCIRDLPRRLKPSNRGELEITDVNNEYIRRGVMTYERIEGWWADCGSFEALVRSNLLVAREHGVDI